MAPPRIPMNHLGRDPEPNRPLRLLERMRRAMEARRFRPRTCQAYADWVRRFVLHHGRRHPSLMGDREIVEFLDHVAVERKVAATTQNQALHALRFLYDQVLRQPLSLVLGDLRGAKVLPRVPVVLTAEEVRAVLARLTGTQRLVALLLYGGGLRLNECLTLRLKDVDLERFEIAIRGGKGGKDRRVPLPHIAEPALRARIDAARLIFREDARRGVTLGPTSDGERLRADGRYRRRWRYIVAGKRFDQIGVRPHGYRNREQLAICRAIGAGDNSLKLAGSAEQ